MDSSSFPRGKRKENVTKVDPLKTKKPKTDVLFKSSKDDELAAVVVAKPKVLKSKNTEKVEVDKVPEMGFKSLKPGMLFLGIVANVSKEYVLVSLPNMLNGTVHVNECCDEACDDMDLLKMFMVGQYVPCTILKMYKSEKHRVVEVSLKVSRFHQYRTASLASNSIGSVFGSVKSIEDHGYIVNLGVGNCTGFMKKGQVELVKGQSVHCKVEARNAITKVLNLTALDSAKVVEHGDDYMLSSFVPGMLMNVRVQAVLGNGLKVGFLSSFQGKVDENHTSVACSYSWQKQEFYTTKTKARARIISIDVKEKLILLSMTPHIVHLNTPLKDSPLKIGSIVEEAVVHKVDNSVGLLLSCGKISAEESTEVIANKTFLPAKVHISRVSDERVEKLNKQVNINDKVTCRLLKVSLFDGVYTATMKKSVIEQDALNVQDLSVGQTIQGTVLSFENHGVILQVGHGMRGMIPTLHLPPLATKKCKVGNKLMTRILSIESGKLNLTAKPVLMYTKLKIISSPESVRLNMVSHGYVTKIRADLGIIVSFFNGMFGLLPRSEFVDQKFTQTYSLGQVVKVVVSSYDKVKNRMSLTLDLSKSVIAKTNTNIAQAEIKSIVSGTVTSIENDHAVVSFANGDLVGVVQGNLNVQVGDTLQQLIVLSMRRNGVYKLSAEELFLEHEALGCAMPASFQDMMHTEKPLVGSIKSIQPDLGIFVEFCQGFTAMVPPSYASNPFYANLKLKSGQPVVCYIQKLDEEKERVFVTLKPKGAIGFLSAHFMHNKQLCLNKPQALPLGTVVDGKIIAHRDYGMIMTASVNGDSRTLLVPSHEVDDTMQDTKYKVGNDIKAYVLDFDGEKKVYFASISKRLTERGSATPVTSTASVSGKIVQIVNDEYAFVRYKKNHIGILPFKNYNGAIYNTPPSAGSKIEATPKFIGAGAYSKFSILEDATSNTKRAKKESTPVYKNYDELALGQEVYGSIIHISAAFMAVHIRTEKSMEGNIHGKVCVTNCDDHVFSSFKIGQAIKGRVVHHEIKGHQHFVELSLSSEKKETSSLQWMDMPNYSTGHEFEGIVVDNTSSGTWIQISAVVRAFCNVLDGESKLVGTVVKCYLHSFNAEKRSCTVTMNRTSSKTLTKGMTVLTMVNEHYAQLNGPALMLQTSAEYNHVIGRVCITDLSPKGTWLNYPLEKFTHGQVVEATVLGTNGKHLDFSLKEEEEEEVPVVGALCQGYVTATSDKGCFIRVSRKLTGHVKLRDLADRFVKSPKDDFPVGTIVAGRVVAVEPKLQLSLKPSDVTPDAEGRGLADFKEGMHVKGTISSCQVYGVFVRFENSKVSGLCHRTEMSDEPVKDVLNYFSIGDYVKARILGIDGKRVSLGLKASYFENDEESDSECESDDEAEENVATAMEVDSDDDDVEALQVLPNDTDSEVEEAEEEPSVESISSEFQLKKKTAVQPIVEEDDFSDSESEETSEPVKVDEIAVRRMEKKRVKDANLPESAEDFERLLLASPNSSYLWIQYITFQLDMTEVDLARDLAQRALSTISFRDEAEKLNVWFAFLNLEHQYGTEETLSKVFDRAIVAASPKKVYFHMFNLYKKDNLMDKAQQVLTAMCKKFKDSKKVWLASIKLALESSKSEESNQLLQKALKSLPKHKHVKIISKYAQLEYEIASVERGRTIFEKMMTSYPKRLDLWNLYIDKEIKYGKNPAIIRSLFERLIQMKFSSKKMKFLFKRYLQYELENGTDAQVQYVQNLVEQFVENA